MTSTNPVNLLRRFFIPPAFTDEKKNQQASILHVLLISLLILGILYLGFSLLLSPQTSVEDIEISVAGILVTAFILVLLRRGYVRLASMIQVASFWLLFTAIAIAQDGIYSPAYMMGYILVILIAGILLGGAGALVMTCLSLATGLGIYYFQLKAALPTSFDIPLIGYWITSAFMFPLCAVLQYLASRLMQQALARASESEERYRSIADVAFEGIMINKDGIILDANRKFVEIFGYTDPEDVIGKNGLDFLLAPESSFKVQARMMAQPGIVYDVFGVRKDGTTFQGETQSREMIYRGERARVVTMRDMTDRIAVAAELRRVNRALETISKCNETLVRSVNEQELLQEICRNIVEFGEYPLACIDLVDTDNQGGYRPVSDYCYETGQTSQTGGQTMSSGWDDIPGMIGMVIARQQPIFINQLSELQGEQTIGQFLKPGICRSLAAIPLYYEKTIFGVLSIFSGHENAFDADEIRLMTEMASDLSYGLLTQRVRADRKAFLDILQATNQELERSYDATLEGWSGALELRERDTAGHSQRVVEMTLAIARAMGMPESELIHIRRGALLHDIGKMGIPDRILLKPGPLTNDEWRTMRHHPLYAQKLLHGIAYLQPAFDIPYYHHERWDGQGYPNKLAGERIPIAARIFAVVDVWDALTSDRPYRLAWTTDEALHYIVDQSGKQFDPQVVTEFTKILENYRQE